MKTKLLLIPVIMACALFSAEESLAADIGWTSPATVNRQWNDSANWNGGNVPGAADNVSIFDLRAMDSTPGGVWMRGNAYHLNADATVGGAAFDEDAYVVTAGCDGVFALRGGPLYAGAFVTMDRVTRNYDNHGDGITGNVGTRLCLTWLRAANWYVDIVAKTDRNNNQLDIRATDTLLTHAKYSNQTHGLSFEVGRHCRWKQFWLEPRLQAAVAFFGGATYTTSNGSNVDIDHSTAVQCRWQIGAGAYFGCWRPYVTIGSAKDINSGGEVRAGGGVYETQFEGWRFEAGADIACIIGSKNQLYLDFEYDKADHYERIITNVPSPSPSDSAAPSDCIGPKSPPQNFRKPRIT